MKNVKISFRIEEDPGKDSRAIYNLILYLTSQHNPKIRIFPLLGESGDTQPRGINLFGSTDEVKRMKEEVIKYLHEHSLDFTLTESDVDVDGFIDFQLPVLNASSSDEMERLLAERSFGFRKFAQALAEDDRKAYLIWRNLKSGISFYKLKMPLEAKKQLEKVLEEDDKNFEAHHHLGLVYEMLDETNRAINEFRTALKMDGDSGATHFFLANALQKRGDFNNAIKHYKIAIELDPDVPIIYNNLAWVFYQKDEFDLAIRAFEVAITIDPDIPFPHNGLGCVLQERGLYEEAVEEFKAAIEIYPEYTAAHLKLGWTHYLMGDYESALAEFGRTLEISQDFQYTLSAHYSMAHTFLASENYREALMHFREVIRMDPDFPDAQYHLGLTAMRLELYEEAINPLERALELDPDVKVETYKSLAFAYTQAAKFSKALQMCKKSLKMEPDDPEIFELMGGIHARKKQWDQAVRYFKKTLDLNPNSAVSHFNLGWSYENMELFTESIDEYKRAIQLNPRGIEAYSNLAWLYKELGKNDEAEVLFERALEIKPGDMNLLNNLGWFYADQGNYEKALQYYSRALKEYPQDPLIHNNIGIIYKKQGKLDEARDKFQLALQLDPEMRHSAIAHFFLGLMEIDQGNMENALYQLEKSCEQDGAHAETYYHIGKLKLEKNDYASARKMFNTYLTITSNNKFTDEVMQLLGEIEKIESLTLTADKKAESSKKIPAGKKPGKTAEKLTGSGKKRVVHKKEKAPPVKTSVNLPVKKPRKAKPMGSSGE